MQTRQPGQSFTDESFQCQTDQVASHSKAVTTFHQSGTFFCFLAAGSTGEAVHGDSGVGVGSPGGDKRGSWVAVDLGRFDPSISSDRMSLLS